MLKKKMENKCVQSNMNNTVVNTIPAYTLTLSIVPALEVFERRYRTCGARMGSPCFDRDLMDTMGLSIRIYQISDIIWYRIASNRYPIF